MQVLKMEKRTPQEYQLNLNVVSLNTVKYSIQQNFGGP